MIKPLRLSFFLVFFLFPIFLAAQIPDTAPEEHSPPEQKEVSKQGATTRQNQFTATVADIIKALQSNSADELTKYFSTKVSLNFSGNKNGVFSLNQAHYIIEDYFTKHKFTTLQLTEQGSDNEGMYASGNGIILTRGKKELVKIYLGFIIVNTTYRVTQFTIY